MNRTEEILTTIGKEFKIILFSKEKWETEIPIILEQTLKFEVYPKDLGEHNWKDAKKVCEDLGDCWRLPTREELHVMYLHKDSIGGFAAAYYWSSSEFSIASAWYQNVNNGNQYYDAKNYANCVRAVRAL